MSTRSTTDRDSFFMASKALRDARCGDKDIVTAKIIASLAIKKPRSFKAILMPSMFGPEVGLLRRRGVPLRNMFSIERNWRIHKTIKTQTTKRAMAAERAVDQVPFDYADFVYLDFFGQPDAWHLQALFKLFRLGLCAKGTRMLVTFGVNRGDTFACALNKRLKRLPGEAYIRAACQAAGGPPIKKLINHHYTTSADFHPATFITTEVHL